MTKKYCAAVWLALSVVILPHLASAQESLVQQKELASDGQPTLIKFSAAGRATLSATDGVQVLRQQLKLGANEDMRPVRLETDQLGISHQKYAQYYKGVKIEHATYTVHARANQVESLSGDYEAVPELSVQPALSAEAALRRVLALVGAKKYLWQDAAEAALKQPSADPAASYRPQGELVLVRDNRQRPEGTGPLVLAWKFDVYATEPVSRAYYYLDAKTGELVLRDDIIKHTAATGAFATAYSGTLPLADETATTGGYRLRDYTRGNGLETYNLRKGTTYASAVDFTDSDNTWVEYNNANHDNAASDAHFGAQSTYDYWKNVHGRNSYNNAGAKILSYVHYDSNYENAFWDGTCMTYGDGGTTLKPLTALDVCGHEIGHAVCEKTANLTYSGESGALNEGLSDIWGACVEKYTADKYSLSGKSTWDVGEEIMKAGGALRSMSNPNLYGQPAYYKGLKWDNNQEVHQNSTVLSYWFYLISVGKTGTNEKSQAYSVTGLGMLDAAKITFRMESVYMTAGSTYANARTYAIQAATDLYGATSTQVQAVTNAWHAVGVGAAYVATYCTSKGSSVAEMYIDYVGLGSISRTSWADGGYYDGTASNTSVVAGSSQTVSFSAEFTGLSYMESWRVYIDYNQDGDFLDSGETVVNTYSSSDGILSATFTVPLTAKTGKTRLRVVMNPSAISSCGTYNYGETEDYSLTVMAPGAISYCPSQGTSVADEYIDYVQLGNITRTSTADGGYYDGFSTTSTSVAAGSSQTLSFSAGFTGQAFTEFFKVYADWNHDGDFSDSDETLVSAAGSNSAATRTALFTVPSTARSGSTRLRVVMSVNAATTSCGSYRYGETEDYNLVVTGGAAIAATPPSLTGTTASGEEAAVLSLYPNPATDHLHLSLSSGAELTNVEVFDLRGAAVPAARYEGNGQLDVTGLAAGLYLLRATDGQHTFVQRFAKQ